MKVLSLSVLLGSASACSTIAAGRLASADGSVFTTHSDDGEGNPDPRLVMVPAKDHAPGSMRPIYPDTEDWPRYIGSSRGPSYLPGVYPEGAIQNTTKPIGHIPEVNHTYQYFDTNYGVMNEHQLHIGESTCSGVFGTSAVGSGGKALLSVNEMSRLAMERCTKSREAVQVIGALAEKYGFYGAGSFEGTAESLLIGDTEEVFVFHVLPDDTGTSAIWVAQRVPDDHVTTVDNMFTIRNVNLTDSFNFYGSASIHTIAQKKGWWKPSDGLIDFTKTYSDGEYAHKYYSGRRMWGVYHVLAPSLNLNPEYGNLRNDNPFPWSVKPDKPVTPQSLMTVHRDHYGGTKFDTTKGLAAGPFGNPDRFKGATHEKALNGSWERTITLFRTTYSFVNQARAGIDNSVGGVTWFGPHAAHGTCYVPLMVGGMTQLPKGYTIGMPRKIDRKASWWAHRYVQNLGHLRWKDMVKYIQEQQSTFETRASSMVDELTSSLPGKESITKDLTAHANSVIDAWWQLADDLMMKYADGFFQEGESLGEPLGYDTWWLKAVGYENGPPPIGEEAKNVEYV